MAIERMQVFALALSLALFWLERRAVFSRLDLRLFTALASLTAALLSLAYFSFVLRGGPRIIDATSYLLEARAMSEGYLAWPVADPEAATMGRFLVRDALGDGANASVIFPPGYPAYLSLFVGGAVPLAGAILAALLVPLTGWLASALHRSRVDAARAYRLGALVSVVCGALRYHTADTMSHGLASVLVCAALVLALRFPERPRLGSLIASGLVLGWLFATRPVSFAALAPIWIWISFRQIDRGSLPRAAGLVAVAMLPGVALFLAHQYAATGEMFASSQSLYYAQADGPSGCFRYGFGDGIGCMNEHGEFVTKNLPHGLTASAAVLVTLRRLKMHAGDALNAWPLALVTLAGLYAGIRHRFARPVALTVPLFVAAYAPFYFDGNYPGGGARFFADVLPIEHALIAFVVVRAGAGRLAAMGRTLPAIATLGFAIFGWAQHRLLQEREGGRPMFEPDRLARTTTSGLVFIDTDHGFSLAFDPGAVDARLTFARYRGDAVDFFAWDARARPPAYRYRYFVEDGPRIEPYIPAAPEYVGFASLWPPFSQEGGYVARSFPSCTSDERASLTIESPDVATVVFDLPDALAHHVIAPRITLGDASAATLTLHDESTELARWSRDTEARCITLEPASWRAVAKESSRLRLVVKSRGAVTLDALLVSDDLSR